MGGVKVYKPDILFIYMELVSRFSILKGFDGWVIAKAEFNIGKAVGITNKTGVDGKIQVNIKFIKQRKDYSIISTYTIYKNLEYAVIMYIVRPRDISNKGIDGDNMADIMPETDYPGFSYLFTLKYTTKDIRKFTEFTGDSNPIHQTPVPIVPGFLMFGDIIRKELYKYTIINYRAKFVISFKNPVFADEPLEVYKKSGSLEIIAMQVCQMKDIRKNPGYKWKAKILIE